MSELESLKKIINDKKVVSFDIFDTLLLRNIEKPTDIFKILDKYVFDKYDIEDFFNMRIESETKSRTAKNNYECTFTEIYNNLPIKSDKVKKDIMKKELELEERFLVANPFMKEIYNYCKETNKEILCISDMYLEEDFISKVLKNNGYSINKIYVSNVYHKSKGNKTLFEEVYRQNKYDKSKWIHIGDNYTSDYEMPINFGISAYNYKNVLSRSSKLSDNESISSSIINAIRNNAVNNGLELNYWEKFGIMYASPLYYAFASWLYNHNKDYDNIYFLARDGYMIKKVFDKIAKNQNNKIDSRYLYVSRRAVQLPILHLADKRDIIDTLTAVNSGLNEKVMVKNVFLYFNIDPYKYEEVINKYGFEVEDEVENEDYIKFKQLVSELYDEVFKPIMVKQTNLISKYLKQENFDKYKKNYLVDVGWRGSIQYSLNKLLDKPMLGYYFATSHGVYNDIYYDTLGFAANYGEPYYIFKDIEENLMIYEFLFSSPEGSLKRYELKNNKVIPITADNDEYSDEISILQDSALKIIDEYIKYFEYDNSLPSIDAINPIQVMINEKKYEDLINFNQIQTNVGYYGEKVSYVPSFTKDEIKKDFFKFDDTLIKSMWKNTFVLKNCKSEEEFYKFRKKINKKRIFKTAKRAFRENGLRYCIKKTHNKLRGRD